MKTPKKTIQQKPVNKPNAERDEIDENFDDIHDGTLAEDEDDLDELPIDAIDGLDAFDNFDEDEDDDF